MMRRQDRLPMNAPTVDLPDDDFVMDLRAPVLRDRMSLEVDGRLVDLSNLYAEGDAATHTNAIVTRQTPRTLKPISSRRLYPSPRNVQAIEDVDVASVLARARAKRHRKQRRQLQDNQLMLSYSQSSDFDMSLHSFNHFSEYATTAPVSPSEASLSHSASGNSYWSSSALEPERHRVSCHREDEPDDTHSCSLSISRDTTTSDKSTASSSTLSLELAPGVYAPLRGSEETLWALEMGQVDRVQCLSCLELLVCIDDANYVLCPLCKVVSPMHDHGSGTGGGIGLGVQLHQEQEIIGDRVLSLY